MGKFRASTPGQDALMVNANRPSRAAQKYADGLQLPPGTVLTVDNRTGRTWIYQVACDRSVKRVRSQEG